MNEVRSLNLETGSYALFGSAPIGVRSMKRVCSDIDIIVTKQVWDEYRLMDEWALCVFKKKDGEIECLKKKHVELYYTWGPGAWDIEWLINSADTINGLPFVKLKHVLEWKQRRKESKDIRDIYFISNYLAIK